MNNGERTIAAIRGAEGKRLRYKDPMAQQQAYTEERDQKTAANNSNHSKKKATPGPKVDRLKLKRNWRDLMRHSLSKKKPAEGWPK